MAEPTARRRLIVNARIATGDPRRPWAEAMLLEGEQLIAVGSAAALRKRAPDAEVENAGGAARALPNSSHPAKSDTRS